MVLALNFLCVTSEHVMGKVAIDKLRAMDRRWRLFPNITTQAKYNFFSQMILLDEIESKHVRLMGGNRDGSLYHEFVKLVGHELRHWCDHVSTLWGQRQLISIFNAYSAWVSLDESRLFHVMNMKREITNNYLPDYYSTRFGDRRVYDPKSWAWDLSVGLRFNQRGHVDRDRPVLFMNFRTQSRQLVCRVPFTVASLLETAAVSEEYAVDAAYMMRLHPDGQVVERQKFLDENRNRMYDAELMVYSVAAHFVANILKVGDLILAFRLSRAIATLCLNLPDSCFENLKVPDVFADSDGRGEGLLISRDRGFVFACLVLHAPKQLPTVDGEVGEWMRDLVFRAGLPPIESMEIMAEEELSKIRASIVDGEYKAKLKKLLNPGALLLKRRGLMGEKLSLYSLLDGNSLLPPVVLGDGAVLQLGDFGVSFDETNIEDWAEEVIALELRMFGFVGACEA